MAMLASYPSPTTASAEKLNNRDNRARLVGRAGRASGRPRQSATRPRESWAATRPHRYPTARLADRPGLSAFVVDPLVCSRTIASCTWPLGAPGRSTQRARQFAGALVRREL